MKELEEQQRQKKKKNRELERLKEQKNLEFGIFPKM